MKVYKVAVVAVMMVVCAQQANQQTKSNQHTLNHCLSKESQEKFSFSSEEDNNFSVVFETTQQVSKQEIEEEREKVNITINIT